MKCLQTALKLSVTRRRTSALALLVLLSITAGRPSEQAEGSVKSGDLVDTTIYFPVILKNYPRVAGWHMIFLDQFDTSVNGWPQKVYTETSWYGSSWILNNQYEIEATATQPSMWYWFKPNLNDLTDFFLASKVTVVTGAQDSTIGGLVFRLNSASNSFYLFEIKNTQQYRVREYANGSGTDVISWTYSGLIQSYQPNELIVYGVGGNFTLYINNQVVNSFSDATLTTGKVGVFIRLTQATNLGQWVFDDFEVWTP